MKKNKVILYDVILSNGYSNIHLGFLPKGNLSYFCTILYDLCSSYSSLEYYTFKKDLDLVFSFLLNTFSISLNDADICSIKRICKTPFFVKLVKFKGVFNDEKQD